MTVIRYNGKIARGPSGKPLEQLLVVGFSISHTDESYPGAYDGSITITPFFTSPPQHYVRGTTFDYSISGGSMWQVSNIYGSLPAGTYHLSVRDRANRTDILVLDPAYVVG